MSRSPKEGLWIVWVIPTTAPESRHLKERRSVGDSFRSSRIFVDIAALALPQDPKSSGLKMSRLILNRDGNLPRQRTAAKGLDGTPNSSPFGVASVLFFRRCILPCQGFQQITLRRMTVQLGRPCIGKVCTCSVTKYNKQKQEGVRSLSTHEPAVRTSEFRVLTTSCAGENVDSTD